MINTRGLIKFMGILLSTALICSCSDSGSKTVIRIPVKDENGICPDEFYSEVKYFTSKYPDVEVIPTEEKYYQTADIVEKIKSMYDSGDLPMGFAAPLTEMDNVVSAGCAADLTTAMKKKGLDKRLNPDWIEYVSRNDKIFAIPIKVYVQGLYINKNLFRRAGLVNSDGSIKYPKTYDEVAEYASIIKEKTGADGFGLAGDGRYGGWQLMNIAWSYGVKFEEKDFDGNWVAAFDSPEFVETLKYLSDLKWKYNGVSDNIRMDKLALLMKYTSNQLGMFIYDPPGDMLSDVLNMPIEDIMAVSMPRGPAGAYAQMGGSLLFINNHCNEREIEALLDWYNENGSLAPSDNAKYIESFTKSIKKDYEENKIILNRAPISLWLPGKEEEKLMEIRSKYCNVDPKDYENFMAFDDVIIREEEHVEAQNLYKILDEIIIEVFSNPNADLNALAKNGAERFQTEYLDPYNEKNK